MRYKVALALCSLWKSCSRQYVNLYHVYTLRCLTCSLPVTAEEVSALLQAALAPIHARLDRLDAQLSPTTEKINSYTGSLSIAR